MYSDVTSPVRRAALVPRIGAAIAVASLALTACLSAAPPQVQSPGAVGLAQRPLTATTSLPVAGNSPIRAITGPVAFPFEKNVGQAPSGTAYLLRAGDARVSFAAGGIQLQLGGMGSDSDGVASDAAPSSAEPSASSTVAIDLVGASTAAPVGAKPSETVVSYFRGPAETWLTNVPTYQQVAYPNAWPGIDVRYERAPDTAAIKSSYVVGPGADSQQIHLAWRGVSDARVLEDGGLEVATSTGRLRESAPIAWQDALGGGRDPVHAQFSVIATNDDVVEVGLDIGHYDTARPLIIDPLVSYHGYIGGTNADQAADVAVDSTGAAYVVGSTLSTAANGFPASVGPSLTQKGGSDAFVAKVKPDGSGLVYAGFIGGSLRDVANGVAIDTSGNAYVIGSTDSGPAEGFPIVGDLGAANRGSGDAFVAKVKPDGTGLLYSGIIGGDGQEIGSAIAADATGNAYITGYTDSVTGFPVGVGPRTLYGFAGDAFVGKIKPDGSGFLYIGYIGGSNQDIGRDIAVDGAGAAYVVGLTASDAGGFPVTVGPSKVLGGSSDAFIAKVLPDGTNFAYAGYIGGKLADQAFGVAIDATGAAYVVGDTSSTSINDGFPATVGPMLNYNGGATDAFVSKVKPDGSALVYTGYIGGGQTDSARSVAVDTLGSAFVVGNTTSASADNFPLSNGPSASYAGNGDAFVSKVKADGTAFDFSGYIGGSQLDEGLGVALDTSGLAYVVGDTASSPGQGFPSTGGPGSSSPGSTDGYIARVGGTPVATLTPTATVTPTATPAPAVCVPRPSVVTQAVANGDGRLRVTLSVSSNPGPLNTLQAITFTSLANAAVTVTGIGAVTPGQRVTLPGGTQSVVLLVGRVTAGQPTTAQITVTDGCGDWKTFAGGGATAF